MSEPVTAVTMFPGLLLSGIFLVRMGHLLRRHVRNDTDLADTPSYRNRLIGLVGRGIGFIGYVGAHSGGGWLCRGRCGRRVSGHGDR